MEGFAKVLDGLLKAPLWLFFAAFVASWVPLLNLPPLVSGGITHDTTLLGLPMAFWAICFTAVFLSSAVARTSTALAPLIGNGFSGLLLDFRLRRLSHDALVLLTVVEDDSWGTFAYDPDALEIEELRDRNMVRAEEVLRSGMPNDSRVNGGAFELTVAFRDLLYDHPDVLRKRRAGSATERQEIRMKSRNALGYLQWARGQ